MNALRRLFMRSRLMVGWFVPAEHRNYDTVPASVWIRCFQLMPSLERLGVRSKLNDRSGRCDVAVFVRCQDETAFERARQLKARRVPVVFDLCANYFDRSEVPEAGIAVTQRHVDECLRMVSVADAVTTASTFIAQRARAHHPNVVYLPDSIDRSHFCLSKPEGEFDRKVPRAIWSGVAPKAAELQPILPLLAERGIELTIIAERPPALTMAGPTGTREFRYAFRPWRYRSFPRDLLDGEVAVGPRYLASAYNQAHSHFKMGVFLNAGIPAITSPIPSYREILDRNDCGVVCGSISEWAAALDRIVADRALLKRWARGAVTAMEPYWTDRVAERYVPLFESLQ